MFFKDIVLAWENHPSEEGRKSRLFKDITSRHLPPQNVLDLQYNNHIE